MSKNALALVDCSNREKLFHFLINTFDRKSTKKEMVSPYDDQLIGKMNFRYSGMEHAMFFTYAHSSEYPGIKFRNHKIIYLSLDVNDISSDIFYRICSRFGGYVIYNDDVEIAWTKIERQQFDDDDDLSLSEEIVAERRFLFDTDEEKRNIYREVKTESDIEEEAVEHEWAVSTIEEKDDRKSRKKKQDKKLENNRNGKNSCTNHQEILEQKEKTENQTLMEQKEEQNGTPKITVRETLRSHERQKETRKNAQKQEMKNEQKSLESERESTSDSNKGSQKLNANHRRGHRGGRKHYGKPQQPREKHLESSSNL